MGNLWVHGMACSENENGEEVELLESVLRSDGRRFFQRENTRKNSSPYSTTAWILWFYFYRMTCYSSKKGRTVVTNTINRWPWAFRAHWQKENMCSEHENLLFIICYLHIQRRIKYITMIKQSFLVLTGLRRVRSDSPCISSNWNGRSREIGTDQYPF